ncbi:unnamed protein product [Ilex paraguariensis]|uniref:RNA helicase n=1 Tax=Ilex paraguariensis TaxID=185542 RepID=A0ABC8TS97_9AQUA
MHSRLGFLLACSKQSSLLSSLAPSNDHRNGGSLRRILSNYLFSGGGLGRRGFCGYAAEQFSDDEYECDYENNPASSSVANIDEWKWKLSLLLRSEKDQEIVSRDKRDRRDYEQISNLAKRMGLYSEMYGKVVVASKLPLPNYRPDLDDKRPQREVVIPLSLQRRVEGLLQEHLDRMQLSSGKPHGNSDETMSNNQVEDLDTNENPDSFLDGSVMEKILQRRSLRMRNMQRAWLGSSEGRKMLDFRRSLRAFKEKERLLQAIARNQIVVISGETGCGKTTQLPQYILESEIESGRGAFCSIICTQPRRISAMAVAERVSTERGEPVGESVGYKVRLEGMKGKNTHLLFCTSGILLRRLLSDRNLNGITHVFVDEIHERGMNEDFLLIVLKDLLPRRRDLRLILMSATLNAELFSNYFGGAPTIHIPGFTYPVRALFLEDVLEMTGYKLTSFNQVDDYGQEKMWKTQRQLVPRRRKNQITALVEDALSKSSFEKYSSKARDSLSCWTPDCIGFNLIEAVLCHICRKERSGAVLVFMTGWEDISCLRDQIKAHPLLGDPNRVLLLTCHGSMATSEQDALSKSSFEKYSSKARDSLSCWTPDCIGFNLIEAVLCHICRKERSGAVLVFMTGWEDISCLRDQIKAHPLLGDPNRVLLLTCHGSMATSEQDALSKSSFEKYSSKARDSLSCWTPDCIGFNLIEAVLCHICRKERSGAVLVFMTGWEDISCLRDQIKAHPLLGDPNRVLLLTCHGSMATSEQKLIFEKPPQNVRKIVLATNMAEASITINDVVFVVDCGKAKETTYDALNNTPCLLPSWISQASARQRRGRAGRVQPGECYHLYPQCVYEAFTEYQLPELLRTPLNSLCLQIKSLQVGSIGDFLSAALQPPEPLAFLFGGFGHGMR